MLCFIESISYDKADLFIWSPSEDLVLLGSCPVQRSTLCPPAPRGYWYQLQPSCSGLRASVCSQLGQSWAGSCVCCLLRGLSSTLCCCSAPGPKAGASPGVSVQFCVAGLRMLLVCGRDREGRASVSHLQVPQQPLLMQKGVCSVPDQTREAAANEGNQQGSRMCEWFLSSWQWCIRHWGVCSRLIHLSGLQGFLRRLFIILSIPTASEKYGFFWLGSHSNSCTLFPKLNYGMTAFQG